jgi:hypothetical protein
MSMKLNKSETQERLKRFRYQIMELEFAQIAFRDLMDTKFHDLWMDFSTHTYHARCALEKLQRSVNEAHDVAWFEEG